MAHAAQVPADSGCEVDGNKLTLLTEGPERLNALLGLIDGAERSDGNNRNESSQESVLDHVLSVFFTDKAMQVVHDFLPFR
jgi:hypothetical protein